MKHDAHELPVVPSLREHLGLATTPTPSLLQVIDALILFDGPILDQRFQDAIAMHPDAKARAALEMLPSRVAQGSRITRRAGVAWERAVGGTVIEDDFRRRAERFLLEGLLESAETQIRLKTFMAWNAPTAEVRKLLDDAIAIHRELTHVLREAIGKLPDEEAPPHHEDESALVARPASRKPPVEVGAEDPTGDLRTQIEAAFEHMQARRKKPRLLVLSANALRHLRDQGVFQDQNPSFHGVPVQIDFSWSGSTYALMSYDSEALDEILTRPGHSPDDP